MYDVEVEAVEALKLKCHLHRELIFSFKDKNRGGEAYIEVGACSGNYGTC